MTQWDKPINYQQFLGIKAQLTRELRLLPADWIRVMGQNLDNAGEFQNLLDTSGQVTEASAAAIATSVENASRRIVASDPGCSTAAGAIVTADSGWYAILPVVVAADGAGAVADNQIIGATASKFLDIELYIQANTTGSYLFELCEDESGTAAAPIPDWYGSPPTFSMVAGHRYGPFRIRTTTDNKTFGIDTMANGSWPNSASVIFYGDYRLL